MSCAAGAVGYGTACSTRISLHPIAKRSATRMGCISAGSTCWCSIAPMRTFSAPAEKVSAYATQLASLLKTASSHAWLLTHRPVWAFAPGKLVEQRINATLQAAIRGQVPAALDLVLSGHLHDFTSYDFGPERPAQLIVGDSGDTLLPLATAPLIGAKIDGIEVRKAFALERFG